MGRRNSRHDRLFQSDAEVIIRDALGLRQTLLAAQLNLKANGEMYWQLNGLVERLHEVMGALAGREPDFRSAWEGRGHEIHRRTLPGHDGARLQRHVARQGQGDRAWPTGEGDISCAACQEISIAPVPANPIQR